MRWKLWASSSNPISDIRFQEEHAATRLAIHANQCARVSGISDSIVASSRQDGDFFHGQHSRDVHGCRH